MPGYLLHSLAFIYTTEKGARVDEGFIGVGFVVWWSYALSLDTAALL